MKIFKLIAKCDLLFCGLLRRIRRYYLKSLFRSIGKNVKFDSSGHYSFSTISIGNDVYIGPGANFSAARGLKIGNKINFGPNVVIMGGDHNTSVIGENMSDVHVKRPCDDLPVVIEDDVWIGANVTILKGVTIHTGSIVAAGAVVTKDVPEYSVAAGVPAKIIKMRWTPEQIEQHKRLIQQKKNLDR